MVELVRNSLADLKGSNALEVCERFVGSGLLIFLPLYKINQDAIKLFLASTRLRLGNYNNPTVKQFTAIFKKLIFRSQLRNGGLGNSLPLEKEAY